MFPPVGTARCKTVVINSRFLLAATWSSVLRRPYRLWRLRLRLHALALMD
jgi:hypothetical protein